jgi:cell cycle checkpoint protein
MLHSLPTPVERRSQKVHKPEFFDYLNKGKDAYDGVEQVKEWLIEAAIEQKVRVSVIDRFFA